MQRVYIETTIPSYLGSRPSNDPLKSSRQKLTHEWWNQERKHYYLFSSIFVSDEASGGDPSAARERLEYLKGIPELPVTTDVASLAAEIASLLSLPDHAVLDASHLAMAIVHRIDFLLTWNCTHLANPILQRDLIEYCSYHNLHTPVICTPELLTTPES